MMNGPEKFTDKLIGIFNIRPLFDDSYYEKSLIHEIH